jgi:dTDP-4-dehydrorhamnose 3,5-epimerase
VKVIETELPGVFRIEPRTFRDTRGEFQESWNAERYAAAGIPGRFVQDNVSISRRGTLRGLHLQQPHAQGKLVQVLLGEVFDVAVDVRLGSPTFGRWVGATLDGDAKHQFYIPPGFAHGFCVLSESALLVYKCSEVYHPESELSVAWNDPELAVAWPVAVPELSPKDAAAPRLAELRGRLPRYAADRP